MLLWQMWPLVLLFIHGGSFIVGGGLQYNASTLAMKHAAVYVTINYRLGAFGFANLDAGRANFGLSDQRSAMRWVKQHIGAFGGDQTRVLIFGESAGAMSIGLHLLSPPSAGLFDAALMESGMAEAALEPIEKPGFTGTIERAFTWTFDVTSGRLVSLSMTQESNGISPIQQRDIQVNQITTIELGPVAQG